jgi:hypothetical protein
MIVIDDHPDDDRAVTDEHHRQPPIAIDDSITGGSPSYCHSIGGCCN